MWDEILDLCMHDLDDDVLGWGGILMKLCAVTHT